MILVLLKSNFWGKARFCFQVFLLLVVSAVGTAEEIPRHDGLRDRADARWMALIRGDFDQAYLFETPAYRKLYNIRLYRARYSKGLRWNQARIVEIDLRQPEVAMVKVEIDYSFPVSGQGMMDDKGLTNETWLWIDGQWWYHAPEPVSAVENPKS